MTLYEEAPASLSRPDPLACGVPSRLAPELRFIIAFCASPLSPFDTEGLDWRHVAAGLERHGLMRLIPAMLARPGLVPPAAVEGLRNLHREHAAGALARVGEVARICALLDQAGVRYLLIKGLALSIQLYGRADARGSKDIDLLVEPAGLVRADQVLRAQGYFRPEADLAAGAPADVAGKEMGYLHHDRGIMIEVHSRLTENAALYPAGFEDLWRTRETVTVGGRALPVLARDRLATYLSAHGAGHCWARLMWLLDIAPLTDSPARTKAALADARRLGLEAVVLHALWLLHRWFGHEVPQAVLARARSSPTVWVLNRTVAAFHADRRWYEQAPRRSWRRFYQSSVLGRIAGYSMKPEPRHWLAQLSGELASPADRMIVRLPPGFEWAYVLLRPFGWLIRRLRR
ncbi:MAG TPA: nucleotidyltransferase family protein [Caulobacteraceae bacterium]